MQGKGQVPPHCVARLVPGAAASAPAPRLLLAHAPHLLCLVAGQALLLSYAPLGLPVSLLACLTWLHPSLALGPAAGVE